MKRLLYWLTAVPASVAIAAVWIWYSAAIPPGNVVIKGVFVSLYAIAALAMQKRFLKSNVTDDIIWAVIFAFSFVLSIVLAGIILGLGGIK